MKRPTHMISSAIDIDALHPDVRALFKGLALYNDGLITIAYREPVILRNIKIDGQSLFMEPVAHAVAAGKRIEIEIQGVWDDLRAVSFGKRMH